VIRIVCSIDRIKPGQPLQWKAVWEFDLPQERRFEASLTWSTQGKGDKDFELALNEEWSSTSATGEQIIRWLAPRSPSSFYGTLIKLNWEIHLECMTSREEVSQAIQISHSDQPIRLPSAKTLKERFNESRAQEAAQPQ
jgi:hypothetical protein